MNELIQKSKWWDFPWIVDELNLVLDNLQANNMNSYKSAGKVVHFKENTSYEEMDWWTKSLRPWLPFVEMTTVVEMYQSNFLWNRSMAKCWSCNVLIFVGHKVNLGMKTNKIEVSFLLLNA